jgi:hypothetical protein
MFEDTLRDKEECLEKVTGKWGKPINKELHNMKTVILCAITKGPVLRRTNMAMHGVMHRISVNRL